MCPDEIALLATVATDTGRFGVERPGMIDHWNHTFSMLAATLAAILG